MNKINYIKIARFFSLYEFECPCCKRVMLSPDLLARLDHLRRVIKWLYNTPAEAHLSRPINDERDLSKSLKKDLKKELMSDKIKAVSTKDGKEVGERTNLGDDFIKRGSEKEEVLVFQIVTTS